MCKKTSERESAKCWQDTWTFVRGLVKGWFSRLEIPAYFFWTQAERHKIYFMKSNMLSNGRTEYTDWMIRLKHAFVATGLKNNLRLDWNAFRHLFEDGCTPIEAAQIDIAEGGE